MPVGSGTNSTDGLKLSCKDEECKGPGNRVQVKWGGGDPRMIFADGKDFVGIAPLARVRTADVIEKLLQVRD